MALDIVPCSYPSIVAQRPTCSEEGARVKYLLLPMPALLTVAGCVSDARLSHHRILRYRPLGFWLNK